MKNYQKPEAEILLFSRQVVRMMHIETDNDRNPGEDLDGNGDNNGERVTG